MSRRFLALIAFVGAIAVLTTGCTAVIVGGGTILPTRTPARHGPDEDQGDADGGADHRTGDAVADAVWPDANAGHWAKGHSDPHKGAHRPGPPHV